MVVNNVLHGLVTVQSRGWHSYTFNAVIRWTRLKTKKWRHKSSVGDWPKCCLFMCKHICAYCRINAKNLPTLIFAKLDFVTVLRQLIYCSTPKTASYNYSLEKLLWNVKFYLNKYFSQTSSHKIVRRNVKLTQEILNLDSKIKHLSPVYKKDIEKLRRRQRS